MPEAHSALLSPRAERELTAAARWIARDNKTAARELNAAVKRAAQQIGSHPYCGRSAPEAAREPFRVLTLRGFPYLLIYDPERQPPIIARIVHGARDLPTVLNDL